MRPSIALVIFLTLLLVAAPVAAAERECMIFVPSVGKLAAVECGDVAATAPPAQSPAPAPAPPAAAVPQTPTPYKDATLEKLRKSMIEWTEALTSASADADFRDTYCMAKGTALLLQQEKANKKEHQRRWDEHVALEAKLGQRGNLVYQALEDKIMKFFLETPVDDALPSTRFEQTPEGVAFVKARKALNLSCQCMREENPPKRMICCDSCGNDTLEARFTEAFSPQ